MIPDQLHSVLAKVLKVTARDGYSDAALAPCGRDERFKPLIVRMVGAGGLEPPTYGLRVSHAQGIHPLGTHI
jgi:hypothetical protein